MKVLLGTALATLTLSALVPPASAQPDPQASDVLPGLKYDVPFFPEAQYDPSIPSPDTILGYPVGARPASPEQIERVIQALSAKSRRARLFEYARSHEGRRLYYLVLSSEANIQRLDQLKADLARLSDPRMLAAVEGDRLAETLPAVAWMAYTIHGDEMSGSDAALALAYYLAASTDETARALLNDLIVIIDPLMNPDGRQRCYQDLTQSRTIRPSVDDQSAMHSQSWPSGRMNHYLFDMNRDWIYGTQPESRGRIAAAAEWHPHFFMESHEMWSQDTFLFLPPREPRNPNTPQNVRKWNDILAKDLAAAFDARGWRYYHGEWNEEWYPGYSAAWAALRNALENLYEQAGVKPDGVRRHEGTIQTYREAVHHQLVASFTNLRTLQAHRREVLKDYLVERRRNVSEDGRYAARTFAILPGPNLHRLKAFVDLMVLQGFEVYQAEREGPVSGQDRLGRRFENRLLPAGTIFVPNRQPEAPLVAALLEFDPHMTPEFLDEERRELLRFGRSRLYDVTAWNIGMLYDVDILDLPAALPAGARRILTGPAASPPGIQGPATVAYAIDGADDRCLAAAGQLMERDVRVRASKKPFQFDGRDFARGSILIVLKDNLNFPGQLETTIADIVTKVGVQAFGVASGLGMGDLPDLGGENFVLLEKPRIAVLGWEQASPTSYGEIWHQIDCLLGLRASYIDRGGSSYGDLRRYNVLILPQSLGNVLSNRAEELKKWVESGGTLIAIGSSAAQLVQVDGFCSTRLLPDVLNRLDEHRLAIVREWEGRKGRVSPEAVWARTPPAELSYPWLIGQSGERPGEEELKRRDQWRSIFHPHGVILAGRVDDRSWLTAGCGEYLPIMYSGNACFIAFDHELAPIRLGVYQPISESRSMDVATTSQPVATTSPSTAPSSQPLSPTTTTAPEGDKSPGGKPGWTVAPPGYELRLRMSGLLWPEAADRLPHAAYVTREPIGAGQVILFAGNPTFRAATLGTIRVFSNAVVYGPGMGASPPLIP